MKFNVPLPFDRHDGWDEFCTPDAVTEIGGAIERAGFYGCLVTDHPVPTGRWLDAGGHHAHDPWVMLSFMAAATKSVRLQTGIIVLPYRNPFILARSIATLDRFSNGRVTVGVGAGYLKGEYKALGVDFEQRNEIMDEYLRALHVSLSGEEFTFEGSGYMAHGNRIQPGPIQSPRPPLLIGGNAKRAIRRAVELGDGWYPFFTGEGPVTQTSRTVKMVGEEDLVAGIAYMKEQCEVMGRAVPPEVSTGSIVLPGEAYSPQLAMDRAGRYAELGLVAAGMSIHGRTRAEWCDNAERFGAEVIAKLR